MSLFSLRKKIEERIENVPKMNELSEDFREGDIAGSAEILADLDREISLLLARKKELEEQINTIKRTKQKNLLYRWKEDVIELKESRLEELSFVLGEKD